MTAKHTQKSRSWNIVLWIAQVLLAGMFLMVGVMKTFTPLPELAQSVPIAEQFPVLIRFIGVSELAGGLGLLLPAALRVLPQLTVTAAYALGSVMVLALLFHVWRGEYPAIPTNIVLGAIAFLIAWGRTSKAPIKAKAQITNS